MDKEIFCSDELFIVCIKSLLNITVIRSNAYQTEDKNLLCMVIILMKMRKGHESVFKVFNMVALVRGWLLGVIHSCTNTTSITKRNDATSHTFKSLIFLSY